MPLPFLIGGLAVAAAGAATAALSGNGSVNTIFSDDESTAFPKIDQEGRVGKTSLNEVIGVIISSRRKALGLKQKDFSDLIGLTDSSVSKIEKGSTALNIESLFIILSVLNISLDEFKELLQLSIYILIYDEKIYVYTPNDLKSRKTETSNYFLEAGIREKIKGIYAISNILKIQIPQDNLGFGNKLIENLNSLDNKTTNDFGDSLEVELIKFEGYRTIRKAIETNQSRLDFVENGIVETEDRISKIDENQTDFLDEMNRRLHRLKMESKYLLNKHEELVAKILNYNQEMYLQAGLTRIIYDKNNKAEVLPEYYPTHPVDW